MDKTNTGFVSRENLVSVMMSLGENLTKDEADEMFDLADADGVSFNPIFRLQ